MCAAKIVRNRKKDSGRWPCHSDISGGRESQLGGCRPVCFLSSSEIVLLKGLQYTYIHTISSYLTYITTDFLSRDAMGKHLRAPARAVQRHHLGPYGTACRKMGPGPDPY